MFAEGEHIVFGGHRSIVFARSALRSNADEAISNGLYGLESLCVVMNLRNPIFGHRRQVRFENPHFGSSLLRPPAPQRVAMLLAMTGGLMAMLPCSTSGFFI